MTEIRPILATVPFFTHLDDQLLDDIAEGSVIVEVGPGSEIITEGAEADAMFVVLEGALEVSKLSEGRRVVLGEVGPGEVQGEMALLEDSPRGATVTSLTPARLLKVSAATFRDLVADPGFVLDMLRTVLTRLRATEATLRHEERMAALGKMAAQLMHELNNPAAAVGRSSQELVAAVTRLGEAGVSPTGEPPTSPLKLAEKEEELGEWLSSRGVASPWELGASLAAAGYGVDDLEGADAEQLALIVTVKALAGEVSIGAGRISELVRVVKGYSFVDQAPIQRVDVRDGLDDTLVLLRHKLADVEIKVDYSDDLGEIEAPGRDLNQVWTNLIDNAADAMPEGGSLRINASRDGDEIVVTVANTGDPIPPDVLPRIFDPFFTTKEPGKGTGLGLHTTHTIIHRMGGSIDVVSGPDETVFTVSFPV